MVVNDHPIQQPAIKIVFAFLADQKTAGTGRGCRGARRPLNRFPQRTVEVEMDPGEILHHGGDVVPTVVVGHDHAGIKVLNAVNGRDQTPVGMQGHGDPGRISASAENYVTIGLALRDGFDPGLQGVSRVVGAKVQGIAFVGHIHKFALGRVRPHEPQRIIPGQSAGGVVRPDGTVNWIHHAVRQVRRQLGRNRILTGQRGFVEVIGHNRAGQRRLGVRGVAVNFRRPQQRMVNAHPVQRRHHVVGQPLGPDGQIGVEQRSGGRVCVRFKVMHAVRVKVDAHAGLPRGGQMHPPARVHVARRIIDVHFTKQGEYLPSTPHPHLKGAAVANDSFRGFGRRHRINENPRLHRDRAIGDLQDAFGRIVREEKAIAHVGDAPVAGQARRGGVHKHHGVRYRIQRVPQHAHESVDGVGGGVAGALVKREIEQMLGLAGQRPSQTSGQATQPRDVEEMVFSFHEFYGVRS
ncbi:MAG: hypothetical protein BWX84_03074 [Verrucomicrobia bacterium ADurb.Bin118]|nr:MAG: hypothetical protein BWX84_03074 [Verrucomicrobia bacterium ADurb.Bin118]